MSLRPLARSGTRREPALHLQGVAVLRTHLPPHLPSSRQRGPWSVPVSPRVPECLGAVGLASPRRQVGVGTPGSRGLPPVTGSPQLHAWPWAARHHSARERSVALRVPPRPPARGLVDAAREEADGLFPCVRGNAPSE